MRLLSTFFSGFIFSLGLVISGMVNPEKVLGFLDIFGDWDASLAFVMAAAVAVTTLGYRWVLKRDVPLVSMRFKVPTRTDIDARLILGPVLFGMGWGLVGLCPGPAIAVLVIAPKETAVFFICMLAGMYFARSYVAQSIAIPIPN